MKLSTAKDIDKLLARYIPLTAALTGKDITLDRMRLLMTALGNPEKRLKIIHIAGTSGKTSTTYYIAALLTAAGKKVGMTVSPHIDSVNERVQINMQPLTITVFTKELKEFLEIIKPAAIDPSYFELLVAFAYWYFDKIGVDYAVVETGLGGLHDGTNIAEELTKICVITDIGYDHMNVLGNTLEEISAQKAGIIHRHNDVYMYNQSIEIMQPFINRCQEMGARLYAVNNNYGTEIEKLFNYLPEFQKRNWNLAYQTFLAIQKRDNLPIMPLDKLKTLIDVKVPARMDIKHIKGKTVVMDGAHNGQKMQAFVSSFKSQWPGQKASVLLSLKSGKDYTEVLPVLREISDTLIITTFSTSQDMPLRSIDPKDLAEAAKVYGFNVIIETSANNAYKRLLKFPEEILVITGSFYLIGQLRHDHKELRNA